MEWRTSIFPDPLPATNSTKTVPAGIPQMSCDAIKLSAPLHCKRMYLATYKISQHLGMIMRISSIASKAVYDTYIGQVISSSNSSNTCRTSSLFSTAFILPFFFRDILESESEWLRFLLGESCSFFCGEFPVQI